GAPPARVAARPGHVTHAPSVCVAGVRRTSLVEDDAPHPWRLPPPHRVEAADDLAAGIADQAGAQRERAGLQDFDAIRLPRERSNGAVEEARPVCDHLRLSAQWRSMREEDSVVGDVT